MRRRKSLLAFEVKFDGAALLSLLAPKLFYEAPLSRILSTRANR